MANEVPDTVELMYTDTQLLSLFKRDERRRGLTDNTIDHHAGFLRQVSRAAPYGFGRLTKEEIEQWLDDLELSPRTRYSYISYLNAFYEWALMDHRLRVNPTREIRRPKMRRLLPRPMATTDLLAAIACASPQIECYLLLAAYAGLRCQEIAGIQRADVVEAEGLLRVVAAKGGDERILPLHPEILGALNRLPMRQSGYLFRGARGDKVSPAMVCQKGNRHLHDSGTASTMHTIRHWFGTHLYEESEGDIRMVQEALGHKDISSTAIYTAFSRKNMSERIKALRAAEEEDVA